MALASIRHATRVEFGDTDMSGWMHFPRIFRYVEEAEHALMRKLNAFIISQEAGGWPRARVECDYRRPLRFGDEIEVELWADRIGGASLTWKFKVWKGEELHAEGTVVAVRIDPTGKPRSIDEETRRLLGDVEER